MPNLVNTLQRAGRSTPFFSVVLPIEIFHRVLFERNSGVASLLRAPMDQTVFANVEVTRTGAAAPVVRLAFGNAVLKPIEARVILVAQLLDLLENILFSLVESGFSVPS